MPSEKQTEPEVMCVGCEGKPSLGNSPCAVCGKQAAEPATEAEPFGYWVKYKWSEGQFVRMPAYIAPDGPNNKSTPLYTRPPESRSTDVSVKLREALEGVTLGRCGSEVTIFCNDSEEADKLLDFLILAQEDGR